MSDWSLEGELCRLAGTNSLQEALHRLGFTDSLNDRFEINESGQWVRGGAETYMYRFSISHREKIESEYIVKACVSFTPGMSLEDTLKEWARRRELLSQSGVATPRLFAYGHGVVIEEYIPYRLKSLLETRTSFPRNILRDLASWAGVLSRLGFAHIDPFDDLRSRGNDVVVVDFGQDMGPDAVIDGSQGRYFEDLIRWLTECKLTVSDELLRDMSSDFMIALMGQVSSRLH